MSLVARHLEANGIATIVVGSARDIVEECAVPRFLFTDFPLGNPCGKPFDRAMQRRIAEMTLEVLEGARWPRTTVQTPFAWDDEDWRETVARIDADKLEELREMGERRRALQDQTRASRVRTA